MTIDLFHAARTSRASSKRRAGSLVVEGLSVLALLLVAGAAARAAKPPSEPLVPGLYCREAFAPLGLVDSARATEGRQVTVQEHPALSDQRGEAASPTADGQPRPPGAPWPALQPKRLS